MGRVYSRFVASGVTSARNVAVDDDASTSQPPSPALSTIPDSFEDTTTNNLQTYPGPYPESEDSAALADEDISELDLDQIVPPAPANAETPAQAEPFPDDLVEVASGHTDPDKTPKEPPSQPEPLFGAQFGGAQTQMEALADEVAPQIESLNPNFANVAAEHLLCEQEFAAPSKTLDFLEDIAAEPANLESLLATSSELPTMSSSSSTTTATPAQAPAQADVHAEVTPSLSLIEEENVPSNLLPNGQPTMNEATGQYPGEIAIDPEAKYATGLVYYHSVDRIPDGILPEESTQRLWFTHHNLEVAKIVIGMPEAYYDDVARGHALYLTGLKGKWTPDDVASLFNKFGKNQKVKASVTLIDQCSGETFRWIIMHSFAEVQAVIKERQGWKFGSREMQLCHAFAPGKAIALLGRSIRQIYEEQKDELWRDDTMYAHAFLECNLPPRKSAECCAWFDNLPSAFIYGPPNTAESSFMGSKCPQAETEGGSKKSGNRLFRPVVFSANELQRLKDDWAAYVVAMEAQAQATADGESSTSTQFENVKQQAESSTSAQSSSDASSPKSDSTIVPAVASRATTTPVVATLSVATPSIAPPAAAVPPPPTSWANVAATTAASSSNHLMIDLHPENRSSGSAPRVQAPATARIVNHNQGEPHEQQMRVVLIYNLPTSVTLKDVSEAIREGPLLSIRFANDADNGARYCGIVFQYARDANAFYQILRQERTNNTPGRFRFIVEAGQGPPYPFDEELENMEHPMFASRRLTMVKSKFFFLFGKQQLRRFCGEIAGGVDKVQLVWLYNGGNATVLFSDVKSAVAVKTRFDHMSNKKTKYGTNMASFEGINTSFSKDPCFTDMNLVTDILDLNED